MHVLVIDKIMHNPIRPKPQEFGCPTHCPVLVVEIRGPRF